MKKYKIPKEACAKQCEGLVCPGCGKTIEPIETVDNSNDPTFWSGCTTCSRFDPGVKPEIHLMAEIMVGKFHYRRYSHFDLPKNDIEKEYQRIRQINGAADIVRQVLACQKAIRGADEG